MTWLETHMITTHRGRFLSRPEVRRVVSARLRAWRNHEWAPLIPIGAFIDAKLDDRAWMRSRHGMVATAIARDIEEAWVGEAALRSLGEGA